METIRGGIVSYAYDFIGQEEIKGNNGFKDKKFDALIREYTSFQNGHAWCVYFTWLCWALAYKDFNEDFSTCEEEFSGGAVRTFRHFRDIGWTSNIPEEGDIAIWQKYKNGKATQYGHAGIVYKVDGIGLKMVCIEGNSNDGGSREGVEVVLKDRSIDFGIKNGLVLKGFIKPFNSVDFAN